MELVAGALITKETNQSRPSRSTSRKGKEKEIRQSIKALAKLLTYTYVRISVKEYGVISILRRQVTEQHGQLERYFNFASPSSSSRRSPTTSNGSISITIDFEGTSIVIAAIPSTPYDVTAHYID
jgi:hypothetical protein